jgi:hypothetical protein
VIAKILSGDEIYYEKRDGGNEHRLKHLARGGETAEDAVPH